jgi:GGDEF domain-containing protein
MSNPIELGGQQRIVSTSIGIAIAALHGQTQSDLLKSADLALYQIKSGDVAVIRCLTRMRKQMLPWMVYPLYSQ